MHALTHTHTQTAVDTRGFWEKNHSFKVSEVNKSINIKTQNSFRVIAVRFYVLEKTWRHGENIWHYRHSEAYSFLDL